MKEHFQAHLQNLDWNNLYEATDPDEEWTILYQHILALADRHFPYQTFSRLKKRAKNVYVLEQLRIHEKDAKKFWETVKDVYHSDRKSATSKQEISLITNGTQVPAEEVPDFMNNFLSQVEAKLANILPSILFTHGLEPHQTCFTLPEIT